MNVKGNAEVALNLVCDLLDELSAMSDRAKLLGALAAFIEVRREYWATARDYSLRRHVTLRRATEKDRRFVKEDSEGGRRAQAVAAGLMDVVEGDENVETGRVNDPDRNFPGDVAAYSRWQGRKIIRALEVRDKVLSESDLVSMRAKPPIRRGEGRDSRVAPIRSR